MNDKNPKFNMLCVYGAYERECEDNRGSRKLLSG